jgi:chromatin segregation and condensation protein Rec8/ScpA/Scc1 (kleisin family)
VTSSLPFLLGRYENPHDLLLDLLQQHGVPIEKLPLSPIAAQYLEYFHAAQEHDFRLDIEWLHMAATLIQPEFRS